MKKVILSFIGLLLTHSLIAQDVSKISDYLNFPITGDLVTSKDLAAWVLNEEGKHNIFIRRGDNGRTIQLTNYSEDDGLAIEELSIGGNGKWIVYVKGGDLSGNWATGEPINPTSSIIDQKINIYAVSTSGTQKPIFLGEGSAPKISPDGLTVYFLRAGEIYSVLIDGSSSSSRLFKTKGRVKHVDISPDGSKLAFSVDRNTHAFIGVFELGKENIKWISPDMDLDEFPKWSSDSKEIIFFRRPGKTSEVDSILSSKHAPWEIRLANLEDNGSQLMWKAPQTLPGSFPGKMFLNWAGNSEIVFLSYHDGWPHLYKINKDKKELTLLTSGGFQVEDIQINDKGEWLLFSANSGSDPDLDIDRRHVFRLHIKTGKIEQITDGEGIETSPRFLSNDKLVYLSSSFHSPALPFVKEFRSKIAKCLVGDTALNIIKKLEFVSPKQVLLKAEDGTTVHALLFERDDEKVAKPAVVFVHGGPQRQMLLAWDHSSYYARTYATNQFLANQGFIVLSVNYRLGIGYGYNFHRAKNAGAKGASEYQDVLAAGNWLASQSRVVKSRIGIYGGSYGGYLTALALGRNSELFSAGVDIHGVHSRLPSTPYPLEAHAAPDAALAQQIALESSPISTVESWKSPVLLIHGDDDRNVGFVHSVDLVQRLRKRGVTVETLAIPNETHHWMLFRNALKINYATAEFLVRTLGANK